MQFAAADCNFAIFEDFMKKTICTILAVIMIVGCFFAFTACNDDAYGKELIENGSFDNGSNGWYTANANDCKTIKKLDDKDNAYLVLVNGSPAGNYVRLYQRVAVKKNGIYKVTARIRNDSLKIGSDDTYQGGGIEITENGARIIASGIEVSENWTTYTAYVKPTNTKEITVAMTLGANGEKNNRSGMLRRRVGAKSQGKRRFGRNRKNQKTAREIVRSFHKNGQRLHYYACNRDRRDYRRRIRRVSLPSEQGRQAVA